MLRAEPIEVQKFIKKARTRRRWATEDEVTPPEQVTHPLSIRPQPRHQHTGPEHRHRRHNRPGWTHRPQVRAQREFFAGENRQEPVRSESHKSKDDCRSDRSSPYKPRWRVTSSTACSPWPPQPAPFFAGRAGFSPLLEPIQETLPACLAKMELGGPELLQELAERDFEPRETGLALLPASVAVGRNTLSSDFPSNSSRHCPQQHARK